MSAKLPEVFNPLQRLRAKPAWKPLAAALAVALLILLLWKLPQYQIAHTPGITGEKRFDSENEARKTLAQLLGGTVVLLGLYFTAKTFGLSRQGHLTDRFTKAIEQLGKTDSGAPNIEVRLGAIYALERLARDSPADHWTIMEVLTAYVRRNAPRDDPPAPYDSTKQPRTDIQAILTVLGRRHTGENREHPGQTLDLSRTRLCRAKLEGNLQGANFYSANLQGAFLLSTNLERARFWSANLQEALLISANLRRSSLFQADLQKADLGFADLHQADLLGAKLMDAKRLLIEQIQSAKDWQSAHYTPSFRAELGLPPEENFQLSGTKK